MLKNKAEQSGGEEVKAPPCETLLKKLSAKLQLHPKPKRAKLKPILTCVSFCPKETNRKKGKEKKNPQDLFRTTFRLLCFSCSPLCT